MYGGAGKHGRGGGGGGRGNGAGKRNIHSSFHTPPIQRSSAVSGGRLSVGSGGPRNRGTSSAPNSSAPSNAVEESFNLVTKNPLDFAMIIRLAPGLVEEIKRVEAEGGMAQIKFDANANNSVGNVINVGSKDFRFTWSRDGGDLCDIYEEQQSGEDGNGLLVESGSAWRKLNVQRVLDESTKNHVKMLSEEAVKKSNSRKAIVLDHGNPSTKSQVKAMAAVEGNPWRAGFKQPPFKKRKADPPPGGSSRPPYKSSLSTITPSKGRPSTSPLSSPFHPSGNPASPFGSGLQKSQTTVEEVPTQPMNKTASSDKEIPPNHVNSIEAQNMPGCKRSTDCKPSNLRSLLISALVENQSNGMSLKALEKTVGDAFPNSARQIEPILKKASDGDFLIKYFLKPGVETESFKTPMAESGSSPEENCHTPPAPNKHDEFPASQPSFSMRINTNELEGQAQLNSKTEEASNALEAVDILEQSPDYSGEKKVSGHSLEPADSSSDSGSDSESDSSDSGSENKSSPRGSKSVSGSSSDSESDASSHSKEPSDVEVDIMSSDDDREEKDKLQASEPGLSKSPIPSGTQDIELGQFGIDEMEHVDVIDTVEIENHLQVGERGLEKTITDKVPVKEGKQQTEVTGPSSDQNENQESQVQTAMYSGTESMTKTGFKHEQSDSFRAPKSKSKRVSDVKQFDDKPDRTKRSKTGSINQQQSSGRNPVFAEGSQYSSPDRPLEFSSKGIDVPMANRMGREGTSDFSSQKGYNQAFSGNSLSDFHQPDQRPVEFSGLGKAAATAEKPVKYGNILSRGAKYPESSFSLNDGFPSQRDKFSKDSVHEDGILDEQRATKISKEGTGEWHQTSIDSQYRRYDNLDPGCSPKENNTSNVGRSVMNGQNKRLQRELSDLELGEVRDFMPEEAPALQKPSERRSSFKGENKPTSSDHWNVDTSKGKEANKIVAGSKKASPPHLNITGGTPDGLFKRKTLEPYPEDCTRPQQKSQQPLSQQNHFRVDQNEVGYLNKAAEASSKNRQNEAGGSPEVYGDNRKKFPGGAAKRHEAKRGGGHISTKESNMQKANLVADQNGRRKDASLTGSNDDQKRKESSPDEISCSYYKYEKKEPEFKGPIKDFSQYKEYVQEYVEKYESYCSLNKTLESDRIKFSKLGKDLEVCKGRDMERYYVILEQLKDSYRQCGARHKRLKKIFVVLHEELKHLKQMMTEFAASYVKN
nr:dentin sialophosphoprotein [Ipomoea batatas]